MTNYLQFAFIYKLYLKDNPSVAYIGQTTDINSRYSSHIKNARDITYISKKLYFFMNFYGIHNFKIDILQTLQDISQYNLNKIEKEFIKTYGTLNSVNVNSNIVLTINHDIILQFTNQLLDKPYTQHYIDTALKYINYKPDNTINNTNNTSNTINTNNTINNTLSKKEKFRLYQQQYRLKLSQEKKEQLKKDNAQRNKHNYHNDSQYRLNKIKQSVDYNKKIRLVYQNLDPTTINNIITQINQNNNDTSKNTLDNTLPVKDTTQSTKDTTQTTKHNTQTTKTTKDTTQPTKDSTQSIKDNTQPNNSKNKLSDIITYNDNNTFSCSICNLTIFNKFYNRHINSKKHINNVQK